ncbi:MAG: phosphatidic acid phosphatase [Ruminococcaceae bacterium]|nr:phosphatidic acid phosphatase [Oscillospiraceae bacterium]
MKRPVVDYREFRLSKINTPQFSHLKLLLGWVGYFALYFITENLIPRENCYVIHGALDDIIPFCEVFVIPYVFWYLLIVISLGYFLLYNIDSFKKLQTFIIITQICAMAIYIAFPNMQDLRPTEFPRENIFTDVIGFLYSFDTDTNVFPSLHVAYSIGIASVWLKEKGVSKWWKAFVLVAVILICLSTAFIKQHSILDAFGAIPVCLLAEGILYGKYWKSQFKKELAL